MRSSAGISHDGARDDVGLLLGVTARLRVGGAKIETLADDDGGRVW